MDITVARQTCQNVREALRLEWIQANGLGGYASSSVLSCHTRRYHGYLVADLASPPGRHVLLSKYEDSVHARGRDFHLSCHKYPGLFFPRGHQYLESFSLAGAPLFRYRIGDVTVDKSIRMIPGRNTTLVRYEISRGAPPVTLRLKPLLAFRNSHALTRANIDLQVRTYPARQGFMIQPYNALPRLYIQCSGKHDFSPAPLWYHNFEYVMEQERGFDFQEDLFQPGVLEIRLGPGRPVTVAASTEELDVEIADLWPKAARRKRAPRAAPPPAASLRDAAGSFLIRGTDGRPGIVAGYHWFGDWGRDTFISLPGLAFCTDRADLGLAVLASYARHERRGLLPNTIGSDGRPDAYNSVDASLWYVWAVQQFLSLTGRETDVRRHLWPTLCAIVAGYAAGTDHGIGATGDGLLRAGSPGTQLTWMDATVHGRPVTPRHGLPVEVNALWLNALAFSIELSTQLGAPHPLGPGAADLLASGRRAFNHTFWLEDAEGLADVVHPDGVPDRSVRPNQIFAVSLPLTPLDEARWEPVVACVTRDLLTPFGLRTLSPRDPAYCGRYAGGPAERDAAYHQGTVWPWLLGAYGEALLRVSKDKARAAAALRKTLAPLFSRHPLEAGLGTVSEVFSGDPPHEPGGCISQAWSVAELIRLDKVLAAAESAKPPATRPPPRAGRRPRCAS